MRQGGFTLLETLVALVVATAAATIILSFTRAQYQRAVKEREHALAVTGVLNNAARLGLLDWRAWPAVPGGDLLTLEDPSRTPQTLDPGPLEARNFLLGSNEPMPPIIIAYTPLQQFRVGESSGRYSLGFVAASLPPPDNPVLPTQLPAAVQAAARASIAGAAAATGNPANGASPKAGPAPAR